MFLPLDPTLIVVFILLIAMMIICVKAKKLTFLASIAAAAIGFLVFFGAGQIGILMLVTFFILSVLATSHKKDLKAKYHPNILSSNARNTGQVFANGGIAGLLASFAIINPSNSGLFIMMLAASLASALADTLSSELGMVYGSRYYNVLSFKKDKNGLDGVVSLEGTLLGSAGACLIALIYGGFNKISLYVALAGIIGNLTDSILGATLERKKYIGNNIVNFLNTLFAALIALALNYILN